MLGVFLLLNIFAFSLSKAVDVEKKSSLTGSPEKQLFHIFKITGNSTSAD